MAEAAGPLLTAGAFVLRGFGSRRQGSTEAASAILASRAQAAGQEHQANQAAQEARIARIAADQTDTQLREELHDTVSTIRAIRASSGAGVDSPTGQAIIEREEEVSERERTTRRFNLRSRARQSDADARFFRQAARFSLMGGKLAAKGIRSGSRMGSLASFAKAGAAGFDAYNAFNEKKA